MVSDLVNSVDWAGCDWGELASTASVLGNWTSGGADFSLDGLFCAGLSATDAGILGGRTGGESSDPHRLAALKNPITIHW